MSESTVALIAVAITTVASVILQVMARLEAAKVSRAAKEDAMKAQKAAESAAAEAKKATAAIVNATAETTVKVDQTLALGTKTHQLVNSAHGASLRLTAELSRWKAEQTGKPADVQAAEKAEQLHREHEAAQAKVDASESERAR